MHPYRGPRREPETAAADYQRLRQLIDRYAPAAKKGKLPILSGEWGYSTFTKGVSLETQAAFAARQQLSNLLNGVPLSIWYDWKNDGTDPNENEHNFGTVLPDPTQTILPGDKAADPAIGRVRHRRRLALATDKDYVLVCTNSAGQQKLAAWTTGEPQSAGSVG